MRRVPARLAPAIAAVIVLGGVAAPAASAADPVVVLTVEINGGASATNDLHVTVTTEAEGATQMKLSNDGVTFTNAMPVADSVAWDLGDTTYGGQLHPNRPGVVVAFDNGTDTWDEAWVDVDSIVYDTSPPTETAMRISFVPGETVSTGGSATHLITWLNDDHGGSGTVRYEVDERTDGGAWSEVSTTLPLPGLQRRLSTGHSHQFQAQGVDLAGNVSAPLLGPIVQIKAYQESSSKIKWSGSWKRVTSHSLWAGAAKSSSDPGAKAKITFTGQSIALVCRLGPKGGMLVVSVDGVKVGTVSLRAGKLKARRVVWAKWWPTSGSHTVSAKVQKAPGGSRAEVDAFIVEG